MNRLLNALHSTLIFLEGKKMYIGSIGLLVLTFLLGRNLVATDTAALITGILSVLGLTSAGVGSSQAYLTKLGASKEIKPPTA